MGGLTFYLKATNFGFNLPACYIINGIEATVEWNCNQVDKATDAEVLLVMAGTPSGANQATGAFLPTADAVSIYGSSTNTWGLTLSPADVNNTNFGVAFSIEKLGGGPSLTASIDHITITVYHTAPPNMSYVSSTTTQNTGNVNPNTVDNQIIGIEVVTTGSCNPLLDATSFSFNTNGTTAPGTDITNAKVYYTGTSSAFATTNQFGSFAAPNGSFNITGIQTLAEGTNYFWLTYDVPTGATLGNFVDAECTSLIVDGITRTPTTTAPTGNRPIVDPTGFTVGSSGFDYTSIQVAYDAVPASLTNSYIIELQTNYTDANEPAAGIIFGAKTTNGYTITVRPAAGVTGRTVDYDPGTGNDLWTFDGADNVILDGRPGGVGTAREWTIRNTRTAATVGTVITYQNDASNNTLNIDLPQYRG